MVLFICAPVFVGTGFQDVSISGGMACGIKSGGDLYCWNKDYLATTRPKKLYEDDDLGRDYVSVVRGDQHTCAIKSNKDLYCWGFNFQGQVGVDSADASVEEPTFVGSNFKLVSLGGSHSCAIKENNDLYCWGHNSYGQLGTGNTLEARSPQVIGSGYVSVSVGKSKSYLVGTEYTCGVKSSGDLLCWGRNNNGSLGNGDYSQGSLIPQVIGAGFNKVSVGENHGCALKPNSEVHCWSGHYDVPITPEHQGANAPMLVGSGYKDVMASNHSICLQGLDNKFSCWGQNYRGQLGDGSMLYIPIYVKPLVIPY